MKDKVRQALRNSVGAVADIQADLARIESDIQKLKTTHGARANALAMAIGAREALAVLWLPEGTTLHAAWDEDLDGLRTGE